MQYPDAGSARVNDPPTSHAAAKGVRDVQKRYLLISDHLVKCGDRGATVSELRKELGFEQHHSISPRMAEMERRGWVRKSDMVRISEYNAPQIVWVLANNQPIPTTVPTTKRRGATNVSMTKLELDDSLYAAMTDALANTALPISSRAKARIAGELTAEALRMVLAQMKADGVASTTATQKPKRTRGPNKPKAPETHQTPVPDENTQPAPFGTTMS